MATEIEFVGFSDDCRVEGKIDLAISLRTVASPSGRQPGAA
jgi:hypothetical protein